MSSTNISSDPSDSPVERILTGIDGLDEVCNGGLPAKAAYLIKGGPGCGKTTLCLQYLANGIGNGESALFISFAERESRIRANAPNTIDLSGIEFLDLSPSAASFSTEESYDVFPSSDVEEAPIFDAIRSTIESHQPGRVVIDSMTHMRYLASDAYQYRKHVLGLIHLIMDQGATLLFTSEEPTSEHDEELAFLSDGVIQLESFQHARRLLIPKLRGSEVSNGPHTYTLSDKGLSVSPRLKAKEHSRKFLNDLMCSGIAALDELSDGGFHRGTVTLLSGPAGVGKSNISMLYMKEAAARGDRSVVLTFEESRDTLLERCRSINLPVDTMIDNNLLSVYAIEPLSHSPDELAAIIRDEVEHNDARIVMLDSLASFRLSIKTDDQLVQRLHEICRYLGNMGVSTILIDETQDVTGQTRITEERFSYLTDNIILMRYIKHQGGLGRVIGILKKRTGPFKNHPVRFSITSSGVRIHEAYESFDSLVPGLASSGNQENQQHISE